MAYSLIERTRAADADAHDRDAMILNLYRGLNDGAAWRAFLSDLKPVTGASRAFLMMRHARDGILPQVTFDRDTPAWPSERLEMFQEAHADWGHLDPLRHASIPSGEPFQLSDVVAAGEVAGDPYYAGVIGTFGLLYDIGLRAAEPSGHECLLGLSYDDASPGCDVDDILAGVGRHLQEVVRLSSRLAHAEAELGALTETLDRLTICTFILDHEGTIIRTNSAARQLIDIGTPFRVINNRLLLLDRSANAAFQAMIGKALVDVPPLGKGRFVDAMPVLSGTYRHLGLLVRTVSGRDARSGDGTAAAVVYVAGPCSGRPMERIVAQLFDLTPSEARLSALLAKGATLTEIAQELNLSENTVRSYCKNILAKTGVSRQADLVRLILRSVAVLG